MYEYIEGGDLTEYIRAMHGSELAPDQIADRSHRIVHQVATTMAHAHAAGFVHRDLKPANALMDDATPGSEVLLVGDWGNGERSAEYALKQQHNTTSPKNLAQAWSGSFTPNYASPEQKKFAPPSPRDDVYSLGVVWYQLLTGAVEDGCPPTGGRFSRRGRSTLFSSRSSFAVCPQRTGLTMRLNWSQHSITASSSSIRLYNNEGVRRQNGGRRNAKHSSKQKPVLKD